MPGRKIQVRYVLFSDERSGRQMIKNFSLCTWAVVGWARWNDTSWNRVINVAVFKSPNMFAEFGRAPVFLVAEWCNVVSVSCLEVVTPMYDSEVLVSWRLWRLLGKYILLLLLDVIGHSPWGFSGPILQLVLLGELGHQLI